MRRATIAVLKPETLAQLANKPRLPRQQPKEDQLGHCMVCGAGFREHIACESGNCHFVRTAND